MLVMFGVEIVVVQNGKTALQVAKERNKHETVKFLKSYLQEVPTYIPCIGFCLQGPISAKYQFLCPAVISAIIISAK